MFSIYLYETKAISFISAMYIDIAVAVAVSVAAAVAVAVAGLAVYTDEDTL